MSQKLKELGETHGQLSREYQQELHDESVRLAKAMGRTDLIGTMHETAKKAGLEPYVK